MNQYKYRVKSLEDINDNFIANAIDDYKASELPRLISLKKMFLGQHEILNRAYEAYKPQARLVHNFPAFITYQSTGYFLGTPVSYENLDEAPEIAQILQYNDESDTNARHGENASIYGVSYELIYVDRNSAIDTRFSVISPEEMFVVYDYNIEPNPIAAIRFYKDADDTEQVEVYTDATVTYYKALASSLQYEDSIKHFFKDVPVVIFTNNENMIGDFENVITLIEEYNLLNSDTANDFAYFSDAYLFLSGAEIDTDTAVKMKEQRIINFPDEGASAQWLVKNIQDSALENYKNRLVDDIHKFSAVPNLTDENFSANLSGVAIRYKLLGLENMTKIKERKFKKGLQRRMEILFNFLYTRGKVEASNYLAIKPIFKRSLPVNIAEEATIARDLNGIVSKETAYSILSFIENPQDELLKMEEERKASNPFIGEAYTQTLEDKLPKEV